MHAVRNRLVHNYFLVDAALLWDTVQKDLPASEAELKSLLEQNYAESIVPQSETMFGIHHACNIA
jgi:uncharacterized protein with HEPN domain